VQLYNSTTQGQAQNFSILSEDKGAGDTDQRHVFNASFNFRPDFYKGENGIVRALVNGWSISPSSRYAAGFHSLSQTAPTRTWMVWALTVRS
jgi:hypothetical protein